VTFDKDFGDLAFRSGLPADCGIVLFRMSVAAPDVAAARAVAEFAARDDWMGMFAVIEDGRTRLRALPHRA
jgi:hypothetical protein